MSLYFDTRVQNPESTSISSHVVWHAHFPFLAVAAYSQDKGGFVRVYDDQGEALSDVESPEHLTARVTALCWHPERRWLIAGWENGDLKLWPGDTGVNEFSAIVTPHRSAITILQWSQHGSRLITADVAGFVLGWKIDSKGQLMSVFHHELKDTLTRIAFRITPAKAPVENSRTAKAAVIGDEGALGLFTSWRPRTAAPATFLGRNDNLAFYITTVTGKVYFIDAQGQCSQVFDTDGATVHFLLHHENRDSIVIMTEGLNISHFQVDPTSGHLHELTKVKLSGKADLSRNGPAMCWASGNTLAILTGDLAVRCWDLFTAESYVLAPPDSQIGNMAAPQEICTSLTFCKTNETLAAGTNLGTIYLWKRKLTNDTDEDGWSNVPATCTVHGTIKQITWGGSLLRNPLLAVNCITNVFVLHQQAMCAMYNEGTCAGQLTPSQILIETDDRLSYTLKTEIQVQLLAISKDYISVSTGRQITTYKLVKDNSLSTVFIGTFSCDAEKLLIFADILLVLTSAVVQLRSMEGTLLQTLPTMPEEGEPITIELTGQYLTVASLSGILKIWDLSKKEAKLHTRAMATYEVIDDFAEIIEARCNSDCRYVSITVAKTNLMPSSILYVWDIESDQIYEFDFGESAEEKNEECKFNSKCKGRLVTAHCWDVNDPRLLVCRAQKLESRDTKLELIDENDEDFQANVILVSMFATADHGIVVQDVKSLTDDNCRLMGVDSPYIVTLNSASSSKNVSKIEKLLMRDFEELEDCDASTKKAILDFSYHISTANMDEAFKAIKSIKNETVWKSLARMCVKTKQLDMALLCLGHMKQARAARALREAMQNDSYSLEAKAAVLAVELGLYDDAERLFREAKRFDLLGKLFEARNKFKEAMELTANEYKIREKTSYYNYAMALEQDGKIVDAIDMYTKADCHRFEVPRMLLGRPLELVNYLRNCDDPQIKKWHAQYLESAGDIEGALRLYELAKDTLSTTRLLCHLGRDEDVCELVTKTNHAASAYHLATRFESRGDIAQAIRFYTIAKAYSNAIRLCKDNDMTEELWPLAMTALRPLQIDAAKYYEGNDQPEKAILLYHKAGLLRTALEVAFKTRVYSALQLVIMDIGEDSDPALIRKCADYLVKNEQVEKAVDLLASSRNHIEALNLIETYDIPLTEDLAEKLTVEKVESDSEREKLRVSTLERIGEIAFKQGNYHLATKKFTQAGNKLRAMKALLKSGDTEKICFFAQVSRQREIYIMAGNYLQSLDWQNQPDVLKNIINFYSKGKAMDLLANFYVACAQVEIDEFQNYTKALDALNQANRSLAKVLSPRDLEVHKRAVDLVNNRMATIKRYLDVRKLFERGETDVALAQLKPLLDLGPNLEESVRRGDLFATITRHYVQIGDNEKAIATIEQLKRLVPGINLSYYYDIDLLEKLGYRVNVQRQDSSDKDDEIEELLGE